MDVRAIIGPSIVHVSQSERDWRSWWGGRQRGKKRQKEAKRAGKLAAARLPGPRLNRSSDCEPVPYVTDSMYNGAICTRG